MKYSYNWLKEISGTKSSPEKISELLMMHSFEVEGSEKLSYDFKNIVVGEILEIKKHPNADKLSLAKVDIGLNKLEIICGALNIQVGQKVPIAMLGAKLPGGEIKEIEIRGVKSYGMLCAKDELGLGHDHSGILILEDNLKIGTPLKKALNVNDTVLDVDILSNRGHDALSHIGLAREICVLESRKLKDTLKIPKIKSSQKLKVAIKDQDLCARYLGVVMENITVKESPLWLKSRLLACGFRPINNIVDATNYVMLETGQPLHAFDFNQISSMEIPNPKSQIPNKLQNSKNQKVNIIVRRAKKGETIKLLDETEKILNQNDLLITNEKEALAIAGIMGGLHSGINEKTQTIVLESANFNATAIRKTRTKLNVKTDASDRFEKDIDPNLAEKAMAHLIEIIQETAGGEVEGLVDVYPKKIKPWKIILDINYVGKLLGETVELKKIKSILESLELRITNYELSKKKITLEIPTFRIDLQTQEDLIEE
ncbi:phenylalanine--tRNA ligase subunit beta, partial [Patescibacteria group bacterium]|nr:phenylalanine--tRNA ligase subunit beta [Patescibacteria group bacterium]